MAKHTCSYIRSVDDNGRPAAYTFDADGNSVYTGRCGKPVGWKMVKDDDDNMVRRYDNLCTFHQVAAADIKAKAAIKEHYTNMGANSDLLD